MELMLFTSAFCGACTQTRATVAEAVRLIPGATLAEVDVARSSDARREALDIRLTPTVIVLDGHGLRDVPARRSADAAAGSRCSSDGTP